MIIYDCEQNSPEWYAARLGIPTASCFEKIITPTGQASEQADGYANELLAELMAGERVSTFEGNKWTQRGTEIEPEAAMAYELQNDVTAEKVGFITDDKRTMGCSPDRLIGADGVLEIKVPAPKQHVKYMLYPESLASGYRPQIQGQLLICGRKWVDIMSYHPLLPAVIIRVERDKKYLFEMASLIARFHKTLNEKKQLLISKGYSL